MWTLGARESSGSDPYNPLPPPSSQLSDSSWPRILKLHRYLGTSAQPKALDACASFCTRQVVRAPAETQRRESGFVLCFSLARESLQSAAFIRGNEEHAFSCTSVPDRAFRLKAEGIAQVCSEGGGSWRAPEAGICLLPRLINCPFYAIWFMSSSSDHMLEMNIIALTCWLFLHVLPCVCALQ